MLASENSIIKKWTKNFFQLGFLFKFIKVIQAWFSISLCYNYCTIVAIKELEPGFQSTTVGGNLGFEIISCVSKNHENKV